MTETALTTYDRIAYPSVPHIDMHPSTLAAIAAVCGHTATARRNYDVLEIGCGSGSNLLSMALAAPDSRFVGIDLAPSAIELANATAATAGLTNIRFVACNILDPGAPGGPFDYIIAHGVYAWVPQVVRERILAMCGQILTPDGIAAISYNVYPGCRIRQAMRDMLLHATRGITDPLEKLKVGREFLQYQIGGWSEGDPYATAMKMEAAAALKREPEVLYHDELGECFEPQILSDTVASARARGLDYLCDAQISLMAEALFPGQRVNSAQRWTGGDWVQFEQMLDFTSLRRFRRSIFTRAGKVGDRRFDPARLAGLFADVDLTEAPADPENPGTFTFHTAREEEISTTNAATAALLRALTNAYPQALDLAPFAAGEALTESFLEVLFSGAITLRTRPLAMTGTPGERPLASALARAQARLGEIKVACIKGGATRLGDEGIKALLQLLDGTRTRDEIAAAMAAQMGVSVAEAATRTPPVLAHLARLGVMVA